MFLYGVCIFFFWGGGGLGFGWLGWLVVALFSKCFHHRPVARAQSSSPRAVFSTLQVLPEEVSQNGDGQGLCWPQGGSTVFCVFFGWLRCLKKTRFVVFMIVFGLLFIGVD